MKRSLILSPTALALAGCAEAATYPEQCRAIPAGWASPSDGHSTIVVVNRIKLSKEGAIKLNGQSKSDEQLREFLRLLPQLNPRMFTILEVERGANCESVQQMRSQIDNLAGCKDWSKLCGEGSGYWKPIYDFGFGNATDELAKEADRLRESSSNTVN